MEGPRAEMAEDLERGRTRLDRLRDETARIGQPGSRSAVLRLNPSQELEYAQQLREATPAQLALARALQRTAFHGRREYEDGFIPAPLYLSQATTLAANPLIAAELLSAIAIAAGLA